jgi:hypothetical protein
LRGVYMRRTNSLLRLLFTALGFLCLGACIPMRADTLTPTSFSGTTATFNGVTITYTGTNPVTDVFGNNGSTASAVESISFLGIGTTLVGIQIGTLPSSSAGNGDAMFNECSGSSCLGTTTPFYATFVPTGPMGGTFSGLQVGGPASAPTVTGSLAGEYDAPNDQACYLNSLDDFNTCNTGSDPTDLVSISTVGDVFTVQSASISFTFALPTSTTTTITPTPEPSNLLMLGSGLLGLLGVGLYRSLLL